MAHTTYNYYLHDCRYWCHFSSQTNLDSFNSDVLKLEPGINCRSHVKQLLSLWIIILLIQVVQDLLLDAFWQFCFALFLCQDFIVEQMKNRLHIWYTYILLSGKSISEFSKWRKGVVDRLKDCHVGTRCLAFLSAERTQEMALCCSNTLAIIACFEPHLVGHSVLSLCWGNLSSFWASDNSLLRLQL